MIVKKNNYKKLYTVLSCLGVLHFVNVVFKFVSGVLFLVLICLLCNCCWLTVCIVVVTCVCCYLMCICCTMWTLLFFLLRCRTAGQKSVFGRSCDRSSRHRFSWFPSVYKQMLRWFPRFQVASTCFSCIPPDLNLLVNNFIFCVHVK